MATKSAKKSSAASSSQHVSTPASSSKPTSPLSPTRLSRLQEKAELQNLNDRLAAYIDRVRQLETENSRLTIQVQTATETTSREITNIKTIYENELSDARRLLDETAKERARCQIESNKLKAENEALKDKLDKKTKDLSVAEKNSAVLENQVADLTSKYNQSQSERKKLSDELKGLRAEVEDLRTQLDECRKQLEIETLLRVDLENKSQSLREELAFKEQVHQQYVTETRMRKQTEISELDGRLHEEYEAKLQQSLQDLREQYESQLAGNRDEVEMIYESKINDLKSQVQRYSGVASAGAEELRQSRTRIDTLSSKVTELEKAQGPLQNRIRELEKQLDLERERFSDRLAEKENELQNLRDMMATQLQEYQDLMDVKVALDLEIAAYRKLLESEEARLNITPSAGKEVSGKGTPRRTPLRATKRKRTVLEDTEDISRLGEFASTSSSRGDIEVVESCPEGKFIRLHNKSDKEVSLGGWLLLRKAGEEETQHKFHRSVKVEAGGDVIVWSSDSGRAHEPPHNILMKSQRWFVADRITTTLFNSNGDEVAVQECKRKQLSTSFRQREMLGTSRYPIAEGDPQGQDRCCVM